MQNFRNFPAKILISHPVQDLCGFGNGGGGISCLTVYLVSLADFFYVVSHPVPAMMIAQVVQGKTTSNKWFI